MRCLYFMAGSVYVTEQAGDAAPVYMAVDMGMIC